MSSIEKRIEILERRLFFDDNGIEAVFVSIASARRDGAEPGAVHTWQHGGDQFQRQENESDADFYKRVIREAGQAPVSVPVFIERL